MFCFEVIMLLTKRIFLLFTVIKIGQMSTMYQKQRKGLTQVPSDIPANATVVRLGWNKIVSVTSNIFINCSNCIIA